MGNGANEGYAEMTICLYLPNGRVGFMFKRPNIENNDALDAGGLTWTMVKPFEELRIDFSGKVVVLDDPHQMADPKTAFANNPFSECEAHITFTGQGRNSSSPLHLKDQGTSLGLGAVWTLGRSAQTVVD